MRERADVERDPHEEAEPEEADAEVPLSCGPGTFVRATTKRAMHDPRSGTRIVTIADGATDA